MSEEELDERPKSPRRKKREAGVAIGAAMVGFEQAVFRRLPPPEQVVREHRPNSPVPSQDGEFLITLPLVHEEDDKSHK